MRFRVPVSTATASVSLNTFVSFVPARLAVCALVKVTAQAATEASVC